MKGDAHTKASLALVVPSVATAALYSGGDTAAMVGAGLGCLATVSINPDLDQEGISRQEWKIVRRTFGLGFLFLLFWWPYAYVHNHRGISHLPVVGTLGRDLYIVLILGLGFLLLRLMGVNLELPRWPPAVWRGLAWALYGQVIGDAAHWGMDLVG